MTPQQNSFKKTMASTHTPLSELSKNLTLLQRSVIELVQQQSTLMEKLDRFVNKVMANEERLKRVEDNLMNHTESATWIKAAIRFCPLLIVALLFSHQIHALLLNYQAHS